MPVMTSAMEPTLKRGDFILYVAGDDIYRVGGFGGIETGTTACADWERRHNGGQQ